VVVPVLNRYFRQTGESRLFKHLIEKLSFGYFKNSKIVIGKVLINLLCRFEFFNTVDLHVS